MNYSYETHHKTPLTTYNKRLPKLSVKVKNVSNLQLKVVLYFSKNLISFQEAFRPILYK